jgi:carbon-monoxide dehydrogenase large subunit
MTDESSAGFFGRSVMRLEDHKLLRGAGRFVDDIAVPGVLHAAFVRSPIAHGRCGASTLQRRAWSRAFMPCSPMPTCGR